MSNQLLELKMHARARYLESLRINKQKAKGFLSNYSSKELFELSLTNPVTDALGRRSSSVSVEGKYFQNLIRPLIDGLMHNLLVHRVEIPVDFVTPGYMWPHDLRTAALEAIVDQHIKCFKQVVEPRRAKITLTVYSKPTEDNATTHERMLKTLNYVQHWRANREFYLCDFTVSQWQSLYEFVGVKEEARGFIQEVLYNEVL